MIANSNHFSKMSLRFKATFIITTVILVSLVVSFIDVGAPFSGNEIPKREKLKPVITRTTTLETTIKILKPTEPFRSNDRVTEESKITALEKDEPDLNVFSSNSAHPVPAEYNPDLARTEDGEYFISHYSEIVSSISSKKRQSSANQKSIVTDEVAPFLFGNLLSSTLNNKNSSSSSEEAMKLCGSARTKNDFVEMSNSECRYQTSCFWHYAHRKCYEIPGLFHPFLPGEPGSDELHCPGKYNKDNNKKTWKPPGYWTESHGVDFNTPFTKKTPTFFNLPSAPELSSSSFAEYLRKVYDRFHFGTSWLFREWKYWEPRPKQHVKISPDDDDANIDSPNVIIKGSHRPEYENLYVLDNFCVEPFGGISGYVSSNASTFVGDPENLVRPYRGKCDTRDSYHQEDSFKEFFQSDWITRLHFPPKYFDERLVLFLRVRPTARFHPAHVLNHFMSALGILRVAKEKKLHPSGSDDDENDRVPPLIMFVNEHRSVEHDTKAPQAWAYFYQLLGDFPWAVVTTGFGSPSESQKYGIKAFTKMFNHSSPAEFWNRARHGLGEANRQMFRVCFKRGILYQNCFDCGHSGAFNVIDEAKDYEKESYSFGMWAPATKQRISLMDEYRNLVTTCLAKPYAADGNTTNNKYRLPRVYFALRTKTRNVRDFSLMYQMIEATLLQSSSSSSIFFPQLVESITYGEPGHGSRPIYIDDIRQNGDIFVGVHGGDVAMTALMPKHGVVLEFTFPTACCVWKEGQPTEPHDHERARRCWLGILVNGSRSDHWVYETRFPGVRNLVTLAPHYFTDAIRDASCRWMFKKYRKDPLIQQELKNFDPNLFDAGRIANRKIAQVVAAMWVCLYKHAKSSPTSSALQKSVPEWNQIYKLTHLPSHFRGFTMKRISEYVNSSSNLARYFRFLWFGMTPGNVDLLATPQLQQQSEKFLSNVLAEGYQAGFVPQFRCYQPSTAENNNNNNKASSCVTFWTLIMGRILELADFNDRQYISEDEEFHMSHKFGSSHQMVLESSKEFAASAINQQDGSFKGKNPTITFQNERVEYIGCLPTHERGSQFSCLYRIGQKK